MTLFQFVQHTIQSKKNTREDLKKFLSSHEINFNDLENAFDHIFRTKKVTSDYQRAFCFLELFNLYSTTKVVPKFTDPKKGNQRMKISNIDQFVSENKNSIFSFVSELETIYNNENVKD